MIHSAASINDLRIPPSNHLEELKGNREGQHSIRINDQYRLAKEVHIPQSRISDILSGKRGITADTAMRFAMYFGTTPQFWLNIQNQYDLDMLKVTGKILMPF